MNKNPCVLIAILLSTTVFAAGCGSEHQVSPILPTSVDVSSPTGLAPASAGAPSLLGTWTSERVTTRALTAPRFSDCPDIQWQVTSQTAASVTGAFTALCPANITISATITGALGGSTIPLVFLGTASQPGSPSCPIALAGTAYPLAEDAVRIDFTGMTCLGPVTGSETLRLASPSPPAPPPPAPQPPTPPPPTLPAPTPPPPADPLLGCGGLTANPIELVTCIHDRLNAPRTVEGAFEITKRVAWAYRNEGGGLLIKDGGENIVSWKGRSFSAGRICEPNGHIWKVLTDVPTTNGPSWQDNDFVELSRYVPAIDPNS
jgi:hypothetical protein